MGIVLTNNWKKHQISWSAQSKSQTTVLPLSYPPLASQGALASTRCTWWTSAAAPGKWAWWPSTSSLTVAGRSLSPRGPKTCLLSWTTPRKRWAKSLLILARTTWLQGWSMKIFQSKAHSLSITRHAQQPETHCQYLMSRLVIIMILIMWLKQMNLRWLKDGSKCIKDKNRI